MKWDEARPISGVHGRRARSPGIAGHAARRPGDGERVALLPCGRSATRRAARERGRGRGRGGWAGVGRFALVPLLFFLNPTQMQLFGKFKSFFMKSAQNKSCREFQAEQLSFRSQLKILNNF